MAALDYYNDLSLVEKNLKAAWKYRGGGHGLYIALNSAAGYDSIQK